MRPRLKNNNLVESEEGFSLVEILVVIAITGIIAWLTLSVYVFGQQFFLKWDKSLNLQNELHVILQGITEDIYRAEGILSFEERRLHLQMGFQNEKVYEAKNDSLFINKRKLLDESIMLVNFRVRGQNQYSEALVGSDQSETGKISLFEISLSLTNGNDTLSATRIVHVRKASNWNMLSDR